MKSPALLIALSAGDTAKQSLAEAVNTAGGHTRGEAGDAGLETMQSGKLACEVNGLTHGAFYDVWVDPASGHVIETATS